MDVERIIWRPLDGGIEELRHKVVNQQTHSLRPERFDWLDKALGKAPEGLRWTSASNPDALVLVPIGWRLRRSQKSRSFVNFQGVDQFLLLRVQTYYRQASNPQTPHRTTTIKPMLVQGESGHEKGWAYDRYNLTFVGDETDMLMIVEAFWSTQAPEDPSWFREIIKDSVHEARLAPFDWSMQPEATI